MSKVSHNNNAFLKAECTMIEFKKCENVFKGFSL